MIRGTFCVAVGVALTACHCASAAWTGMKAAGSPPGSPRGGNCYAPSSKDDQPCPCCEVCPEKYCSPNSNNCYDSKVKDYYVSCSEQGSPTMRRLGAGGEALGDVGNHSAMFFT
eukprot:TRINITY_DN75622_c0_g1_i1.p1 TRINITY_DN75622_c0_g1~~TRINITY_DN75622_c0_g1_i1.p1  ORF type:complete len:114 (-),score=6.91 TRINITY_DN75622_c0_g1_i1:339-680(-)